MEEVEEGRKEAQSDPESFTVCESFGTNVYLMVLLSELGKKHLAKLMMESMDWRAVRWLRLLRRVLSLLLIIQYYYSINSQSYWYRWYRYMY